MPILHILWELLQFPSLQSVAGVEGASESSPAFLSKPNGAEEQREAE